MAMVDHQIESFVQKFRALWASGLSAHLDLECGGGEAWVGLRLRLGYHRAGGEQQEDHGVRHRRGASYARRLARRAANRTAAEQADSVPVQAEQAMDGPAHEVGEGDATARGEGGVVTAEEVVEAVDDNVESEDVSGDAAVSTEEVEELASARDATANVEEASDADSESDASGDLAISTEGVEDIAVAKDTTANEDEASDITDEDSGEEVCPDCGFQGGKDECK